MSACTGGDHSTCPVLNIARDGGSLLPGRVDIVETREAHESDQTVSVTYTLTDTGTALLEQPISIQFDHLTSCVRRWRRCLPSL